MYNNKVIAALSWIGAILLGFSIGASIAERKIEKKYAIAGSLGILLILISVNMVKENLQKNSQK